MSTWLHIVGFELRYYGSRISTHVYFGIFFLLGVIQMAGMGGLFPGVPASGFTNPNVQVDSPFAFAFLTLAFSLFGTMVVAAVAGHSAQRDFGDHMHPLVFTTPVRKSTLLSARFVVAWLVGMYAALGAPAGMCLTLLLPVDPDFTGSFTVMNVVVPLIVYVAPNLLLTTALFFAVAGVTRRMFPNYVGGIALLIAYLAAGDMSSDLDNKLLAAMLDPFGMETLSQVTRYWTPIEKNTLQMWPDGLVLANRALWGGLGVGVLLLGSLGIRFSENGLDPFARFRRPEEAEPLEPDLADRVVVPAVSRSFGASAAWVQYRTLTWRAFREVLGNRYFAGIVGGGFLFLLLQAQVVGSMFGTTVWPTTYQVLETYQGALGLFMVIVITFYAGDLVHRERDLEVDEVVDATPVPTGVLLAAKITALSAVVVVMQTLVLVAGVGTQAWSGYTHFELGLYAQDLYVLRLVDWLTMMLLAYAVHVVVNHKYFAHFLMILFWFSGAFRSLLGFEHNLPWFGSDPGLTYSDMNGWGSYRYGFVVYKAYWLSWGLFLLVLAWLLVVRGAEGSVRVRLAELRRRAGVASMGALALTALSGVGLGAFIFVNTNVHNRYRHSERAKDDRAAYEKRYEADWEGRAQPRVTAVDVQLDLHPSTGAAHARVTLDYVNPHPEPIAELFLERAAGRRFTVEALDPGVPHTALEVDEDHGVHRFTLDPPLAPGQRATLTYAVSRVPRGFPNSGAETTVVANGTFINSASIVPHFGYVESNELTDKHDRRQRGLEEEPRMADLDDPVQRMDNYISDDADWIEFSATVSTDPDQIALAPGYLEKEWTEGGRRYFRYQMDAPILHFTSFLSARWEVTKGEWNGIPIEVYHHPEHTYNVQRMIESVQKSLAYFTEAFGPYQHRQVRILEFPRYAGFAQSFPNTIPYSESIGFIARIEDPDEDIDYPFYVTSHEIAHQWWAHQVIGGNVQGSTVLSETLSQYSALMVMEREYGRDQIRRFLEYELDTYLRGRTGERIGELPLMRVENQGYIHYNKGSLVMYQLRDELGEDVVNAALRRLIEKQAYRGRPYPTSRDLLAELEPVVPPELGSLLEDLFETITLYDNRTEAATWAKRPDGKHVVRLDVKLAKLRADAKGLESPVPMDDRVEVGVFAGDDEDHPEVLYLEKHRLTDAMTSITVVVDREPMRAGVDPWHKLVDRDGDDNVARVSEGEADLANAVVDLPDAPPTSVCADDAAQDAEHASILAARESALADAIAQAGLPPGAAVVPRFTPTSTVRQVVCSCPPPPDDAVSDGVIVEVHAPAVERVYVPLARCPGNGP